jgi:tetratricopeptide (TPR) repeat protein
MGKTKEAIDIFKLNVEAFPQSFNTYGSLGEAYMKNGDKELAIQNYKKSLELNPQNTGATRALAQLNNAPANAEKSGEIKIDPKIFDAYVGDYELAPNFILTVTREGDHLMTQASGQPKVEIYPSSETEFFLKVVDAQVTFVKNEQGQVTQLILHQGGQNIPAKKIK